MSRLPEPASPLGKECKTFASYQRMVERTDERKQRIVSLLGLVGEVGDLHSMMKKLMLQQAHPSFRNELREEFGDLLWYLTSLASLYKIPLQEIAQANAQKAESLYLEGELPRYDSEYPELQRLPRAFVAKFTELPSEERVLVKITMAGVSVDALTDNAHEDDGYRYHDVFHCAYAAVLGWSPVIRKMLGRKRKGNAKVDEVEDGARAAIVEEAVSVFIFNQASERGWYEDAASIDIGLLKMVKRLTDGLEVRSSTAKQWKSAVFQGYKAFRELRANNGGEVEVNLDEQRVTYRSPPLTRAAA